MTVLVLVRHATTPATGRRLGGRTPGVDLDDRGRDQAEALGRRLAELPVAAVYASPLARTRQTAQRLARPHGLQVRTRQGLIEVDYGEWTDRPLGQLRRRTAWQVVQRTPSRMAFPGGESIRAAQARVVDTLEALAAAHRDQVVIAVSHADVIKAAIAQFLAMPLDAFQRLEVAPASFSVLHLADGAPPVLTRFNDTGSLPAAEPAPVDRAAAGARRRAGRRS